MPMASLNLGDHLRVLALWPKRIFAWLARARLAFFALSVVFIAAIFSLDAGTEQALRMWGLSLQLLGISAAALGIRDTRRMFGKPSFLQSMRNWIASMPGPKPKATSVSLETSLSVGSSASCTVWRGASPNATLEERLSATEANLREIRNRLSTAESSISDNEREMNNKLREEIEERREQDRQLHLRIEAASTDGLHLAAAGAFWLGSGVVMSAVPGEILSLHAIVQLLF